MWPIGQLPWAPWVGVGWVELDRGSDGDEVSTRQARLVLA
jgi:hypothetical protein